MCGVPARGFGEKELHVFSFRPVICGSLTYIQRELPVYDV